MIFLHRLDYRNDYFSFKQKWIYVYGAFNLYPQVLLGNLSHMCNACDYLIVCMHYYYWKKVVQILDTLWNSTSIFNLNLLYANLESYMDYLELDIGEWE